MEKPKRVRVTTTLKWLGHASFRIQHEGMVVYIDPWKLSGAPHDADIVLVSHSHHDHYSPEDIGKIKADRTRLLSSADVIRQEGGGEALKPGSAVTVESVRITAVPAYNPKKPYHPREQQWLGFVIEAGSKRIYYAGDTDLTEQMKALKGIDVALLPVGGTYTMDAAAAAEAAEHIRPDIAIPYHWGDIVGSRADAEDFAERCTCTVRILGPGKTIALD